jgi:hypothetical protein
MDDIAERKKQLSGELSVAIRRETFLARWNHRFSVALMVVALACSIGAAIGGIFFSVSSKIVGGIAILPPLIAFVAINLKFDAKASWHYRKRDALESLRSRLLYQQPTSPSTDSVASVASDWAVLNRTMQVEWDRLLAFNWNGLTQGHANPNAGN